jgi:hypothetical protein
MTEPPDAERDGRAERWRRAATKEDESGGVGG